LAAHAAALALLLIVLMPVIGTTTQFSADEGAAVAQAVNLERGDGWTIAHPFRAADPAGDAFPLEQSLRSGDRFAPFAQHPAYPALLAGALRVAGRAGTVLLSIAGTVAAAVLTALLARRLDRSLAVPALWVLGVASPLFFDSFVVIAHTIAAACAAAAVLCALRIIKRPSALGWHLGLLLAIATGVVLRTEMLLFAIALSAGLILTRRPLRLLSWKLGAVPVIGAAVGLLGNRLMLEAVVSASSGSTARLSNPSGGFIVNRILAFVITWLLPSYSVGPDAAVLLVAVAAGTVAAFVARTRPSDHEGIRLFAVVAGVTGLGRLLLGPGPVPGLLLAFPLIAIGVVALGRRMPSDPAPLYATTFVLFALAVLATQYAQGGAGEWGGRYFALGLPLLVPLLVYSVREARRHLDRKTAVIAAAGLITLSLAMSVLGVVTLRHFHRQDEALVAAIASTTSATAATDGGKPVVVSSDGAAARLAFTVLDRTRWLSVSADQLEVYGRRLRGLAVGPITFVTRDEKDVLRLEALYRADVEIRPAKDWIVVVLRPR
jgi:hypothetical protein